LEEIVVIGYGSIRKSDLTGSVANVSSEKMLEKTSTNPLGALQGKVAGFAVNNNTGLPGGSFKVNIRGYNSINATNDPLFVVDGVIGADFGMLNTSDIESVDVLKDASSTAIYGARGANGVILITTKRGKTGAARVSYNGSVGIGFLPPDRKIEVLNSAQYMEMERQAWGWKEGRSMPDYGQLEPDLFNPDGTPRYDTDWQDEALQTALATNHSLSISGGTDRLVSSLSLGYDNNEGIMLESYYKKYTAKLTNTFTVNKWLKADMSLALLHSLNNNVQEGSVGALNATRMLIEALPIIPIYNPDGTWGSNAQHLGTEGAENPVKLLKNMTRESTNTKGLGDFNITLTLAEGLELKSSFSSQIAWYKFNQYYGRDVRLISKDQEGIAHINANRNIYLQNENYLTYSRIFNDIHSVNAVAGASWNQNNYETFSAESQGFADDFFQWNNLGAGTNPRPGSSGWDEWRMNSYFGRVNYVFNNRYLATITARVDGSSRFGKNHKYASFPSGALAWRISEEEFMKSLPFISNLKLRTSYGFTGNDAIPNFQALSSTSAYTAIFDGNRYNGIGLGRIPNADLRWEKTGQFDAGIDLGIINNRLNVSIDYYYKKTVDLLLNAPLAATSGYTSAMKNIGNMENKGIELTINAGIVQTKDFAWNVDLILSSNRNKILKLGENDEDIYMGPYFLDATNILRVGEAVNSYVGYVRLGTWGTEETAEAAKYGRKPGDLKWADLDSDGKIDSNDRRIIGNGLPKLDGNLNSSIRYKNIDLAFDIAFRQGNDIMRLDYSTAEDRQTLSNSFTSVLDAWRPDNQNTMIASVRVDSQGDGSELKLSDHYIEDGSFIRGSNIMLGYTFNTNWLKKLTFEKLRLYVNAQNFFLITKYKGYDPETTTYGDTFAQGVEFFNYPKPRVFNVGINIVF
jgi:TonB-linked SusC/RagA family outer membrane protein